MGHLGSGIDGGYITTMNRQKQNYGSQISKAEMQRRRQQSAMDKARAGNASTARGRERSRSSYGPVRGMALTKLQDYVAPTVYMKVVESDNRHKVIEGCEYVGDVNSDALGKIWYANKVHPSSCGRLGKEGVNFAVWRPLRWRLKWVPGIGTSNNGIVALSAITDTTFATVTSTVGAAAVMSMDVAPTAVHQMQEYEMDLSCMRQPWYGMVSDTSAGTDEFAGHALIGALGVPASTTCGYLFVEYLVEFAGAESTVLQATGPT